MRQLCERTCRTGREIRARQASAGSAFEHPGREHDKEVGLEGVPLHLADAGDGDLARLAGDIEGEPIADLRADRILELRDERYQRLAGIRRAPPAAGEDTVV